jgi:hypothetical protein
VPSVNDDSPGSQGHDVGPDRARSRLWQTVDLRHQRDSQAAVIAAAIGLLALVVSAYTAYLQRQQVRAMVWPSMQVGTAMLSHKLTASNYGMGPARITGAMLKVDGKVLRTWDEAAIEASAPGAKRPFIFSSFNGRVVPPGGTVELFHAADSEESRQLFTRLFGAHEVSLLVCYCSVLENCWLTGYGYPRQHDGQRTDERCPISDKDQFRN